MTTRQPSWAVTADVRVAGDIETWVCTQLEFTPTSLEMIALFRPQGGQDPQLSVPVRFTADGIQLTRDTRGTSQRLQHSEGGTGPDGDPRLDGDPPTYPPALSAALLRANGREREADLRWLPDAGGMHQLGLQQVHALNLLARTYELPAAQQRTIALALIDAGHPGTWDELKAIVLGADAPAASAR